VRVSTKGTSLKCGYLSAVGLSSLKMVVDSTDMLLNITSTSDGLLRIVNNQQ